MAEIKLYGKDDHTNEYRIFTTQKDRRCKVCAFFAPDKRKCVRFNQTTNGLATCNKFHPETPRTEVVEDGTSM